ncbi:MAG: hydrogenase maturation nickel metallochaperone HypA [Dehalococcoidales bacterium]|nr:hydrogenase maturation nickel metallochaperone HypA [Dehalococcoidales bacterium]
MHEASITESMLALAVEKAKEAKARKIAGINLVVGELSGVVPDCVQFYFDVISKNTLAEGAKLNFETKPIQIRCRRCNIVFAPSDHKWVCPECNETSVEITSGQECYMESLEVE